MVHAGQDRLAGLEIGHTMRLAMVVITPVAIALFLTAEPLAALLFNYGAASAAQAQQLGIVISIFMLGLPAFTLYYVLQRGWYAREDTRTPFLFAVLTNAVLIVLAIVLFQRASPGAPQVNVLAAAYALANIVTLVVAWPVLRRAYGTLDSGHTLSALVRLAAAGALALVGAAALVAVLQLSFVVGESKVDAAAELVVESAAVFVVFAVVARVLRVAEMAEILDWGLGAVRKIARRGPGRSVR
jgi:putative peptidoglycan lipid II flippase